MTGKQALKKYRDEGFTFKLEPKVIPPKGKAVKTKTIDWLRQNREIVLNALCEEQLYPLKGK